MTCLQRILILPCPVFRMRDLLKIKCLHSCHPHPHLPPSLLDMKGIYWGWNHKLPDKVRQIQTMAGPISWWNSLVTRTSSEEELRKAWGKAVWGRTLLEQLEGWVADVVLCWGELIYITRQMAISVQIRGTAWVHVTKILTKEFGSNKIGNILICHIKMFLKPIIHLHFRWKWSNWLPETWNIMKSSNKRKMWP